MEIKETELYSDEDQSITALPVAGGTIYRHTARYNIKGHYGLTNSITFVPDSLFIRLKNFLRGLWK